MKHLLFLFLICNYVHASECKKLFKNNKQSAQSMCCVNSYQDNLIEAQKLAVKIQENLQKLAGSNLKYRYQVVDLRLEISRLIDLRWLIKNKLWYELQYTKKHDNIKNVVFETVKNITITNIHFIKNLDQILLDKDL